MSEQERIIAGAMSGTSADGVDVAITRIAGRGTEMSAKVLRHHHRPYPAHLQREIFAFRGGEDATALAPTEIVRRLAVMGREISLTYAAAVNETLAATGMSADRLAAVAAHGQTLFHHPPDSIQWLDPALLAAEVGCAVVSDFRRADLAVGGQGAPLVPFADYILFRDATKNRVLLNIGGIANITYLRAGGRLEDVIAFDTGPGNCISDWICRTRGGGSPHCDINGAGALRGHVIQDIADRFLAHPYFHKPPPKSTDGPEMIEAFAAACGETRHDMNDLLATAASVTVMTIGDAIKTRCPVVDEIIASGGGVRNKAIMSRLRPKLPSMPLRLAHEYEIGAEAKEAVAFALLAAATLDGVPSNVPSVTGARRAVVLGSITPRP